MSDAAEATSRLLAGAEHLGPLNVMPYEWHRVLRTVNEATELSPQAGLALLEALAEKPDTAPEASCSLVSGVLMALRTSPTAKETVHQHASRIEALLGALWNTGTTRWEVPSGPSADLGWLYEANNRWPGLWVPIIRSWALTRGFALHPGTRNRYEIRDTRTQHRPASRQVNDHGRVSGTHTVDRHPLRAPKRLPTTRARHLWMDRCFRAHRRLAKRHRRSRLDALHCRALLHLGKEALDRSGGSKRRSP